MAQPVLVGAPLQAERPLAPRAGEARAWLGPRRTRQHRRHEAWCFENDVDITPYGSWTLESKESERGVEPDDYVPLERSALLPGIDLEHLLQFIGIKPMTRAVREYRAALKAARGG